MARLPLEGRPALGPADAPVTLVEFTDYQCPFCGRHNNVTAPKLREHYGDMLRVIVLHFPLADIHPLAPKAAEAAECAADQGKFWEYNDTLHADQSAVDPSSLLRHAETLGLDIGYVRGVLGVRRQAAADRAAHQGRRRLWSEGHALLCGQRPEDVGGALGDDIPQADRPGDAEGRFLTGLSAHFELF